MGLNKLSYEIKKRNYHKYGLILYNKKIVVDLTEGNRTAAMEVEAIVAAAPGAEVLPVNYKIKFRRNMTTTILTFAITLLSVTVAWAYDFKVGDLCYNITDNGSKTVEVTFEQESLENNYSYLSGVVTIPATATYNNTKYSVTSIGEFAFYDCSAIIQITILATEPPRISTFPFYNISPDMLASVPAEALDTYKKTKTWKEFKLQGFP